MAVEAQYTSTLLLRQRNEEQETMKRNQMMDYNLLQTQTPAHPFLLPSAHPRSTGGATAHYMTGAGKRERESDHLLNNFSSLPINRFSKQQCVFPHHPQWLQTEKRQQPNSLVSTALHLSFSDNSRQQQRQDKLHGLRNQINTDRDRDREREEVGNLDLTAAINFHNDEIDSFLQVQREQLRRMLEETQRKHYLALISAAELSAARRMQEKAAELETAAKHNAELEERLSRLKSEITSLQVEARADEMEVASLQAQLRQAATERVVAVVDIDNPAVSDEESSCVDPRRERRSSTGNGICRKCWSFAATVVVLPCQHLCVCRNCDGGDICPVCSSVRSASIEVYLS
ncbi:hypothetical protein ZOSMA_42G01290 [Zostera marina]|uniref:RING-type domain-containing protein n=1 Tax=Zostera marina TaxID=29655 RepID=A0A0K9P290_ZOSMR|nr:hypothetical protein ZOSMA_42G01290 [Zostera marina]